MKRGQMLQSQSVLCSEVLLYIVDKKCKDKVGIIESRRQCCYNNTNHAQHMWFNSSLLIWVIRDGSVSQDEQMQLTCNHYKVS